MNLTPIDSEASLILFVDQPGQTAELMFYKDGDDLDGVMVGMIGSLEHLDALEWVGSSAAQFHKIAFRKENVDSSVVVETPES